MLAGMGVAGDGVATADIGEIPQTKWVASSEALSLCMVVPSTSPEGFNPQLCLGLAGGLWEN